MALDRIETCFATCKAEQRAALGIFISAGDPDLATSTELLLGLPEAGADFVELGMPFSDPMADGPVIQAASLRAIKAGITLDKVLDMASQFRAKHPHVPLILMGYFNPMMQYGIEKFCQRCEDIGIDGLIIPDLPVDVYHEQYKNLFDQHGLYNMFLITPQTPDERIRYIDQVSNGFIYMVSSASVTGAKNTFGQTQTDYFNRIAKMELNTPTVVGFGISNAETYDAATTYSKGAIIGSAFIKFLKEKGVDQIYNFVAEIRQ